MASPHLSQPLTCGLSPPGAEQVNNTTLGPVVLTVRLAQSHGVAKEAPSFLWASVSSAEQRKV